jgi:hypothetical protein
MFFSGLKVPLLQQKYRNSSMELGGQRLWLRFVGTEDDAL